MKRLYSLFACLVLIVSSAFGQVEVDQELSSLIDVVKLLRVSSEVNYNKAKQLIANDEKWTLMNETGDITAQECRPSDKVKGFKLNQILWGAEKQRKYVSTHGDMVNGENANYDYSLYERCLKGKATASYTLKGRDGRQLFVIVPYNKDAQFEVSLTVGGKKVGAKADRRNDGCYILSWNQDLPKRDTQFVLTVQNRNGEPQPFVIINHNTRSK